MANIIEKIQNKPRFIRIQILWIAVILVMIIIVFIWLSLLNSSLGLSESKKSASQDKQSLPSLFTTIKEDFSLLKKSLQTRVGGIIGEQEEESKFEIEIVEPSKLPE